MSIIVVGLNHKSAGVDVREKVIFDQAEIDKALRRLKARFDEDEFALLSTCNRVELYCVTGGDARSMAEFVADFFSTFHDVPLGSFEDVLYVHEDYHAVRHLLAVAAGLDSMVVGESQILGQVKESYRLACTAGTTGKVLNKLFHCAFSTGKKVHAATSISHGRVSVAGVAVDLARQIFEDLRSARVLVVGTGQTGQLVVRSLMHEGCRQITVLSRSRGRAEEMADRCGFAAVPWNVLPKHLPGTDIVITASGGGEYVITRDMMEEAMQHRGGWPVLVIDIAVPRNCQPTVHEIDDVYLYSIDDLSEVADKNRRIRREDVDKGMNIAGRGAAEFMKWFGAREIGPLIGRMKQQFEKISSDELERFFVGPRRDASCRNVLEPMVRKMVNKLLHCVIGQANELARRQGTGEAARMLDSIVRRAEGIADPGDDKTGADS